MSYHGTGVYGGGILGVGGGVGGVASFPISGGFPVGGGFPVSGGGRVVLPGGLVIGGGDVYAGFSSGISIPQRSENYHQLRKERGPRQAQTTFYACRDQVAALRFASD